MELKCNNLMHVHYFRNVSDCLVAHNENVAAISALAIQEELTGYQQNAMCRSGPDGFGTNQKGPRS